MKWLAAFILAGTLTVVSGRPLRSNLKEIETLPLPPNVAFFQRWGAGLGEPAAMAYWLKFLSTVGGWLVNRGTSGNVDATGLYDNFENKKWMREYLRGIVALAPAFPEPYLYGGVVFFWFANAPNTAIEFLTLGAEAEIERWEIPYYLGFFLYRQNRFDEALPWLRKAASYKDASYMVALTASLVAAKRGSPEDGVALIDALLQDLPEHMEPFRLQIEADRRLQASLVTFNAAVDKFKAKFDRAPKGLDELVQNGFLTKAEAKQSEAALIYNKQNFDSTPTE